MSDIPLKKTPAKSARHSKELIEWIKQVRQKYPDAVEAFLEKDGKRYWVIQFEGRMLTKAHETQWAAWEEAFNGLSSSE